MATYVLVRTGYIDWKTRQAFEEPLNRSAAQLLTASRALYATS